MIEVPIYNQSGTKVDTFKLDPAKLGGEVRTNLLKQALVMYHANQRQGTVQTQARGEVAGSTRKLLKQKRPKDWRQALPKKAKRLATQSALLSKFQSGDVRVLSEIKLDAPKTKQVAQMYKKLGIDRSCLLAITGRNEALEKSARNIDRTTLTTVAQLNAWDILRNRTLLMKR